MHVFVFELKRILIQRAIYKKTVTFKHVHAHTCELNNCHNTELICYNLLQKTKPEFNITEESKKSLAF